MTTIGDCKMLLDDIRMEERAGRVSLEPFKYSAQFPLATFVVNAIIPVNVQINADSDFIWRYTTWNAFSAAGVAVAVPDVTVTFFETGAGRNMQDQAVHLLSCAGTAQLPYVLPEPKRLQAASVLTVTATNLGPANMLMYLTFHGYKLFKVARYER